MRSEALETDVHFQFSEYKVVNLKASVIKTVFQMMPKNALVLAKNNWQQFTTHEILRQLAE